MDDNAFGGQSSTHELSLSLVEKYLLKIGWSVCDQWDPASASFVTIASREPEGARLAYSKPTHVLHGQGRKAELLRIVGDLGRIEGQSVEEESRRILTGFSSSPPGYRCRLCGRCCTRMRDAYQGLVSQEEVDRWASLGMTQILRLVAREERKGYAVYSAWKNPKTNKFFRKCPWIRSSKTPPGFVCAIHEHKPLKCRSFPFSREQAEYSGCWGFEE